MVRRLSRASGLRNAGRGCHRELRRSPSEPQHRPRRGKNLHFCLFTINLQRPYNFVTSAPPPGENMNAIARTG